ncbi:glyoxalase domain-containing protein 4 [Tribolium madens]|uniref:glyoxalase domain-containing protein 4 n=1 Tax=Tribolium madens TaxID=41895 RepID=UPI001CF76564|nr:glyoxalase domain-containing protein 4 [Tribolium madens]
MGFITGRALHYVFKIPDRKQTAIFYRDILGMKVLRHEEFADGCEAVCNGPYANRWSKTMVGYGPESTHFAIELTYNYGIKSYEMGNDYRGITIRSKEALQRAKENKWPILDGNILEAPGGYKFQIIDEPQPTNRDPVVKVTLSCSNLTKSINYWNGVLGLTIFGRTDKSVLLGFKENEAKLELEEIGGPVERAKAYGRIAFACPAQEQPKIAKKVEEHKHTIFKPLMSLDTPGKATVHVIILCDPDGHEICFVDEEGFTQLSQVDPNSDRLLDRYIARDKS